VAAYRYFREHRQILVRLSFDPLDQPFDPRFVRARVAQEQVFSAIADGPQPQFRLIRHNHYVTQEGARVSFLLQSQRFAQVPPTM
jgi:hypothetical protein